MRVFALFFLSLISPLSSLAEDSWIVPDGQMQNRQGSYALPAGDILKWCEHRTKKVRYSQTPVPGYELCGDLQAVKLCNASGKRFISKPGKELPAADYKDCSAGQRITVIRHDPLPERVASSVGQLVSSQELPLMKVFGELSAPQPMDDKEYSQALKDFKKHRAKSGDPLVRDLQAFSLPLAELFKKLASNPQAW